ncbi:bestrophin family protein [Altererythrobacter sp. KTW20L]|uniref:bestrophin family protein n=1 Tax=Altererythrobacter sp. KTW20L TaxID=2942210 RepID=UPI0020BF4AF3|nr:bestrophin family protein [Altererythrobacter sp. KTW20L]MCL6250058.1 bestrophin family protein [Altererythrobacter sp. KTW20L]
MIVRDTPGAFDLIFAVRGSIVPRIALRLVVLMLVATAMVWLHDAYDLVPDVGGLGFTVFGIALSLFLGFRNNAAYDRWWEARKLWGGLLADMRSLAREADIFVADPARRHDLLRGALAFLHLHRANLRGLADDATARQLGGPLADAPHPPDAALDRLATLVAEGEIDGFGQRALAERLSSMALQQAGCERIATTPLPYVYSLLIYRTTWLFCLLLPLALVGPAGWLTPLFVGIVGYVFFGLAEVTEELSHPFGQTPNGLPLDAICRAAEIALAPHLGEPAPEPLEPKDYFLS